MELWELQDDQQQHQRRGGNQAADAVHYGIGSWIVVVTLTLILMAAVAVGYLGWTSTNNDVPTSATSPSLGVIFSLLVGVGLMTLIFYSCRAGYVEPAVLVASPNPGQDEARENSQQRKDDQHAANT